MSKSAKYMNLPFDEAIEFFKQKINLPTQTWKDIWQGMHSRAFVIAGGMREDFLTDMRGAVERGIAKGTTIEQFRTEFDAIVDKYGWKYKGGRRWRTGVIFNTNLSVAYSSGHWAQMTDPDVVKYRPYIRYVPSHADHKRLEHMAWYNLVLAWDDPFWDEHFPPNGWGCKCGAASMSGRELARLQDEFKASRHPIKTSAPPDEYYEWTDRATGMTHKIQKGIDPGWAYNPGKTAWGKNEAFRMMEDQGPWVDLDPRFPSDYGLSQEIPSDIPRASLGTRAKTPDQLRNALKTVLGGKDATFFTDPTGAQVLVSNAITDHILEKPDTRWDGRETCFPLIPEVIENPAEIWINFAQSDVSGRVAIRKKYVKMVKIDKTRVAALWAEVSHGHWVSQDFFKGGKTALNNLRKGRLLWKRG